ncbi:alpha-hydroxy-acid oxidizing protein [Couchioplanes azureus]|uniref:alpha-hydroxy-acid oxidizing protein n=1 Tax=Couchioplanes caeruleus TaxID=56438 RepID=UPI0016707C97|nr:alpha-hydroxy-acid oxidizing protein [Couchioplanes caeruleus]GGQ70824.1 alpha-hydroxy-acid oxidizing enzyme [Couchioplanes caeruleus subsp. azureus]
MDLEERARAVLPPAVFEYYRGGAGAGISRDEATAAWRDWRFLPRLFQDVSRVSTEISLFGTTLAAPVLAGPTALHTLAHPEGEVATARGVAAAGSVLVHSARAGVPVESDRWWFQAYVLRDRSLTEAQVRDAADRGARAVVLTADAPYVHRSAIPEAGAAAPGNRPPEWRQDPALGVDAIAWLAGISGLPVLVKGVLRPADALAAVAAGAAGVIVSNHGGRQLDRAVSSAHALRPVVEAVGARIPVLVDGGIRDGADVLTALALGARAVLLGRPVLWALATDGAQGVRDLLDACRESLADTMAQAGLATVADINASVLVAR